MAKTKHPRIEDYFNSSSIYDLMESSMELSLVHCGKEKCEPLHSFKGKRDEYIIHFVSKGKGSFSVDNKTWHVSAGQMFIIYPDMPVFYIADESDPWHYEWVGFKGTHTNTILTHCGFSADNPVIDIEDIKTIGGYIDNILSLKQFSFAADLTRQGILLELLGHICELNYKNTGLPNNLQISSNIYVDHAIDFINRYYGEHITVAAIADCVGISRVHLNNCFKQEMGVNIQSFLIDYRLHQASLLLTNTNFSVTEIALKVGYPDSLSFSKAFKKKYGSSPKYYRISC